MVKHADHAIKIVGVYEGIIEHQFICLHDSTGPDHARWYCDDEGTAYPYCLVSEWYDNDGLDMVSVSYTFDDQHRILLWTTFNYAHEPLLMGRNEYIEWRESYEDQDQADDSRRAGRQADQQPSH